MHQPVKLLINGITLVGIYINEFWTQINWAKMVKLLNNINKQYESSVYIFT